MNDVQHADPLEDAVRRGWRRMLLLGILFVILGVIGLGHTVTVTVASVVFFGVLLLIGGAAQIVQVFFAHDGRSRLLSGAMALLYLVAGYWTITHPAAASAALTLMLGWLLVAIGVVRVAMALTLRGQAGWFWPVLSGILTIVLGAMVLAQWPASGLVIIGLFIAIDLLLNGWSLIVLALAARRFKRIR